MQIHPTPSSAVIIDCGCYSQILYSIVSDTILKVIVYYTVLVYLSNILLALRRAVVYIQYALVYKVLIQYVKHFCCYTIHVLVVLKKTSCDGLFC